MPNYKYGRTLRERLLSRLVIDHATGCLLWTGPLNPSGYGHMGAKGGRRMVHRIAWELENGPIPAGMQIDHVYALGCRNRHCANVAHLEPVTPQENTLRSTARPAINALKTHCDQGHPFDERNTYFRPAGGRNCRECSRKQWRDDRRRQRASRAECGEGG